MQQQSKNELHIKVFKPLRKVLLCSFKVYIHNSLNKNIPLCIHFGMPLNAFVLSTRYGLQIMRGKQTPFGMKHAAKKHSTINNHKKKSKTSQRAQNDKQSRILERK